MRPEAAERPILIKKIVQLVFRFMAKKSLVRGEKNHLRQTDLI